MAEKFRFFMNWKFRLFRYAVHKEASPAQIAHRIAPLDGEDGAIYDAS